MNTKIVLTGGGTAGHIMPNLALLPYLKERFDKVIYMGGKDSMEERICSNIDIVYYSTSVVKFNRGSLLKNINIPFKLTQGIHQAKKILISESPNIIFSKGGYSALPSVLAGKRLGIPVVCHESDSTMGLANKITAGFADKTYTAFPDTYKNASVIPTPIRDNIFEGNILNVFKNYEKPAILFMGGSLGAEAINDCVKDCLSDLTAAYNVIHIRGGDNNETICQDSYYSVYFTDKIADFFKTADLVVCRAGASTMGELAAIGKRILAIPLPAGNSRGDQLGNAEYYAKHGVAAILPQDCLSCTSLLTSIRSLLMTRRPTPLYDKKTPQILADELLSIALMEMQEMS